jgi:hypothetical protein
MKHTRSDTLPLALPSDNNQIICIKLSYCYSYSESIITTRAVERLLRLARQKLKLKLKLK